MEIPRDCIFSSTCLPVSDVESCSGTMSPGYLKESTVSKQRVPTLVLPALAICFLVCRLISRRLKRLSLGMDDYTLIVGQVGRNGRTKHTF